MWALRQSIPPLPTPSSRSWEAAVPSCPAEHCWVLRPLPQPLPPSFGLCRPAGRKLGQGLP